MKKMNKPHKEHISIEDVDQKVNRLRNYFRALCLIVAASIALLSVSCESAQNNIDYSGAYVSNNFCGYSLTIEIINSGGVYTLDGKPIEIVNGYFEGTINGANHSGQFSSNGKTLDYKQSLSGTTCDAIFQKK